MHIRITADRLQLKANTVPDVPLEEPTPYVSIPYVPAPAPTPLVQELLPSQIQRSIPQQQLPFQIPNPDALNPPRSHFHYSQGFPLPTFEPSWPDFSDEGDSINHPPVGDPTSHDDDDDSEFAGNTTIRPWISLPSSSEPRIQSASFSSQPSGSFGGTWGYQDHAASFLPPSLTDRQQPAVATANLQSTSQVPEQHQGQTDTSERNTDQMPLWSARPGATPIDLHELQRRLTMPTHIVRYSPFARTIC